MEKKRFAVSLVYVKNIPSGQEIALRCIIVKAFDRDHALGLAIIAIKKEVRNYNLSNHVVLDIDSE